MRSWSSGPPPPWVEAVPVWVCWMAVCLRALGVDRARHQRAHGLLAPQILTCLLTEQRIVFFSSNWALLTLVTECFLVYLHPLQWKHTFVPILSGQMLDFVMAPTSFLMGCHLDHFEEVSKVRCRPCERER